jgi:hypothetical protein
MIAENQAFVLALRDSLRLLSVDMRQIFSYTVIPGSIVVGLIGSGATIGHVSALAQEDKITVTYEGVVYRLLRRTTTTTGLTTESSGKASSCLFKYSILSFL